MRTTRRQTGTAIGGAVVALAFVALSGCSTNDIAEDAAERAGIDNLDLGGSGTVTMGEETIEFEVATCLQDNGSTILASASADPAVAVDSGTGSLSITNGEDVYVTSSAEVTVEDGVLTATGTAETTTIDGVPGQEPVELEVKADCG